LRVFVKKKKCNFYCFMWN